MDSNLIIQSVETENIRNFKVRINGENVNMEDFGEGLKLLRGDEILIYRVNRYKVFKDAKIVVNGLDDLNVQNSEIEDVSEDITYNTSDVD